MNHDTNIEQAVEKVTATAETTKKKTTKIKTAYSQKKIGTRTYISVNNVEETEFDIEMDKLAADREVMINESLIYLSQPEIASILDNLLKDKATGKNILWATDTYNDIRGVQAYMEMKADDLIRMKPQITPRVNKEISEQARRTKKHAEVFTPTWLCNLMNNYLDDDWFGVENVFNTMDGHEWTDNTEIVFPEGKDWKKYVQSRRLEITCGEAPYLVSPYDTTTGEVIDDVNHRIGILDRKLRVINQFAADKEEWLIRAKSAYNSTYGYEWQGDNLLIARINLMLTFDKYYSVRWGEMPSKSDRAEIATIICWNIIQMDGLKYIVPDVKNKNGENQTSEQMSMFYTVAESDETKTDLSEPIKSVLHNAKGWRGKPRERFAFEDIAKGQKNNMKFDYVIGNPPYQVESVGANANDRPVYHLFYDEAIKVGEKIELITPARFLFNSGSTPSAWNEKMLNSENFKVLKYEPNSSAVFNTTDIKGGVAITYFDEKKKYDAIGIFSPYKELNFINAKVWKIAKNSMMEIMTNRGIFRFSKTSYSERPNELSNTSDARISTTAFERMPSLFLNEKPADDDKYIQIFGRTNNERTFKWVKERYVDIVDIFYKYKVLIAKANGNGEFGEVLSSPVVLNPETAFTETFIAIGGFDSLDEANNAVKYIKTKFARAMLGILKVTQNNPKQVWGKVPAQIFSNDSDINWNTSISNIDKQLYKKYGLSQEEIDFIETHVKEMA